MKQGKAKRENNAFVGMGLVSNAFGAQAPRHGERPSDGTKREPSANGINPGYVSQLGNKVGNHITDDKNTGYTGEKMYDGRGFEAPRNKSQSHNSGSQGSY